MCVRGRTYMGAVTTVHQQCGTPRFGHDVDDDDDVDYQRLHGQGADLSPRRTG